MPRVQDTQTDSTVIVQVWIEPDSVFSGCL